MRCTVALNYLFLWGFTVQLHCHLKKENDKKESDKGMAVQWAENGLHILLSSFQLQSTQIYNLCRCLHYKYPVRIGRNDPLSP